MRSISISMATALLTCLAGCGERATPESAVPATDTATPAPRATGPTAAESDEGVVHRFDCQADTTVAVLDNGDARVSLPGGERHVLSPVAGSEPQVYTGDSLYFTIGTSVDDAGARTAHLSQQDGMRELACNAAG